MQRWIAGCFLLTMAIPALAQETVNTVGNVEKVSVNGQTIHLKISNAAVEITVCSPTMVRVRMDRQPLKAAFSYAVIAQPQTTAIKTSDSPTTFTLLTDSLQVVVQKKPYAIRFLNIQGQEINADEKGLTTSWVGENVTTYKHLQEGERFVGLGEKTGPLDRFGNAYTNWNSDVFGYAVNADPIYSTIPFYIGIHHHLNYGILLDNTYQSDFSFGASTDRYAAFGARAGEMQYYFIYHQQLADIISEYTALTGRMPLPPLWSLGYQQNRYSYYPDTEVRRIAQTLREKKIPADGITLDIHYMDNYKLFTWNKDRFPDPKKMISDLKADGFRTTLIVDPGIKVEDGYAAHEEGLMANVFIKYSDGQLYSGQVWPGWCNFTDFTDPRGRAWWKQQLHHYTDIGVAGIWNDMNEIATWGQKMPNNVLFNYDGHPTTHLQAHNVYALNMARSSYEGAKEATHERPFILTRAGYAGLQRYTAIWTGDNRSEDDHMLAGVRLLNSLGLSGVAFTGMDIGGFTGNASVGLYTRWIQLGAFIPYYRSHTAVNTRSSEPWTYGEETMEIARNYINLRYKLMPYLYSTFYTAAQTGLPVQRSLAIDYTYDDKVYDPQYQQQFFFGPALMVIPVTSQQTVVKTYFPEGDWYDLYNDTLLTGAQEKLLETTLHKLPVYVRESSIIPMQSLVQSTSEKPDDTLRLHIYKGHTANHFTYYEDDGISYAYEQGTYYRRDIAYTPATHTITLGAKTGKAASKFGHVALILHGFENLQPTVNGKAYTPANARLPFLSPISRFDPQGGFTPVDSCKVQVIQLLNSDDKVEVNL
ncbi:DUF4968 domain-containing protein [Chitinophaga costaii]|nr:DUF4968 domain-containing protein [Chitinophaga costaii]